MAKSIVRISESVLTALDRAKKLLVAEIGADRALWFHEYLPEVIESQGPRGKERYRKIRIPYFNSAGETFTYTVTVIKVDGKWKAIQPLKPEKEPDMAINEFVTLRNIVLSLIQAGDHRSLRLANGIVSAMRDAPLSNAGRRELHSIIACIDMLHAFRADEPVYFGVYDRVADPASPILVQSRFDSGHLQDASDGYLVLGWSAVPPCAYPYVDSRDLFCDEDWGASMTAYRTIDGRTIVQRVAAQSGLWWQAEVVYVTTEDANSKLWLRPIPNNVEWEQDKSYAPELGMVDVTADDNENGEPLYSEPDHRPSALSDVQLVSDLDIKYAQVKIQPYIINRPSQIPDFDTDIPTWFHMWDGETQWIDLRNVREDLLSHPDRFLKERMYRYESELARMFQLVSEMFQDDVFDQMLADSESALLQAFRRFQIAATADEYVEAYHEIIKAAKAIEPRATEARFGRNGSGYSSSLVIDVQAVEIDWAIRQALNAGDFPEVARLEKQRHSLYPPEQPIFAWQMDAWKSPLFGVVWALPSLTPEQRRQVLDGIITSRHALVTDAEHEQIMWHLSQGHAFYSAGETKAEIRNEYLRCVSAVLGVPYRYPPSNLLRQGGNMVATDLTRRSSPPKGVEYILLLDVPDDF